MRWLCAVRSPRCKDVISKDGVVSWLCAVRSPRCKDVVSKDGVVSRLCAVRSPRCKDVVSKDGIVSRCFQPSQPQRIRSRLKETLKKRNIVERTTRAETRQGEHRDKAELVSWCFKPSDHRGLHQGWRKRRVVGRINGMKQHLKQTPDRQLKTAFNKLYIYI